MAVGWCPYCNLELKALQKHQPDFELLNAGVFAIAPEKSMALIETKAKAAANFRFLWDNDNKLARRLGISFAVGNEVKDIYGKLGLDLLEINGAWELPVPATFVVRDGRLKYRFLDANYLERQDPAELIAWLKTDAAINRAGALNG
ncbi:redoxin domain-containing protein [Methylocystis iwaonis]